MVRRDGGGEFAIGYEILELVEPELIVLRSDPMPEMGMHEPTVVRVEFHDHGAKTRMTLSDGPYPAGARPRRGRVERRLRQARDASSPARCFVAGWRAALHRRNPRGGAERRITSKCCFRVRAAAELRSRINAATTSRMATCYQSPRCQRPRNW